ncbi:MAG TPA: hypothetical protein VJ454_16185 [Steroidobacteraceae bacterium]|nr:hypothetical protein [Steroidobacteraceae bacterium]
MSAIAETRLALVGSDRYITVENPDITQGGWRAAPGPADRQGSGAIQAFPSEFHEDFL